MEIGVLGAGAGMVTGLFLYSWYSGLRDRMRRQKAVAERARRTAVEIEGLLQARR